MLVGSPGKKAGLHPVQTPRGKETQGLGALMRTNPNSRCLPSALLRHAGSIPKAAVVQGGADPPKKLLHPRCRIPGGAKMLSRRIRVILRASLLGGRGAARSRAGGRAAAVPCEPTHPQPAVLRPPRAPGPAPRLGTGSGPALPSQGLCCGELAPAKGHCVTDTLRESEP